MPKNILFSHIHSGSGSQVQHNTLQRNLTHASKTFTLSSQSLVALSHTMTEFLPTNPLSISIPESPRFPFPNNSCLTPITRTQLNPNSYSPFTTTNKTLFASLSSRSNGTSGMPGPSKGYSFYSKELEFGDTKVKNENKSVPFDDGIGLRGMEDSVGLGSEVGGANDVGSREREKEGVRDEEDLVQVQGGADGDDGGGLRKDEGKVEKFSGKVGFRKGKDVIRRSNLLAKQVISIRSALSLGFVSQLWVDTTSWMVLFVEVRPNLLSGDSEKFLLDDISQVGDVVLVQDESVMQNEYKMVGLETLVGYKVVTPSQRNIGKVRGYTFSINSGAVEELELDSFGLSIIPSSLVSTYSLLVEDVLEVVSDAVVVHEAAASRIQRLSKGFLGNQNVGVSVDDDFEDYDTEQSVTYGQVSRRRKRFGRKKPNPRHWNNEDDWDLPMDFL